MIQDTATSICNTVKEQSGNKSTAQIEGDIKAQLGGLAGKLANAGVSGKITGRMEDFEGLSQDATATALNADRNCRERIFNKMFDQISIDSNKRSQNQGRSKIEKFDTIYTTYTDGGREQIERLRKNDGRYIYVDKLNADVALEEGGKIAADCFPKERPNKSAFEGYIKGKELPLPVGLKGYKDATFECHDHIVFQHDSKEPLIISSGGTGTINILIRKTFLVNMSVIGGSTVFYLKEEKPSNYDN